MLKMYASTGNGDGAGGAGMGVGEVDGFDTEKVGGGMGMGGPDSAGAQVQPTNMRDRELTKLESYQLKKGEKRE